MLVAHGTNELNAKEIERVGYIDSRSYFADMSPQLRTAILSAATYAFKFHPLGNDILRLHFQQKCVILSTIMKKHMAHSWTSHYEAAQQIVERHISEVSQDYARYITEDGKLVVPGLIYIVDAPKKPFRPVSWMESLFSPDELISTERVPIDRTKKILTIDQYVDIFQEYGHPTEVLDLSGIDSLPSRLIFGAYARGRRLTHKLSIW